MAFDFAFDIRGSQVEADPSYAVELNQTHIYPTTFTNVDGLSINAGWIETNLAPGLPPAQAAYDVRLRGHVTISTFPPFSLHLQVDLGSGSSPGPGDYLIDLAIGDAGQSRTQNFKILDNLTTVVSVSGATYHVGPPQTFIDASGGETNVTDGAGTPIPWAGPQVPATFSTNTLVWAINSEEAGVFTTPNHFRLMLVAAAGGGGAGACECSFFHSFDYREVSDFMDCVVGRRS